MTTGRRVLFAGLYLCEGAPIGFLWWAMPTVLRVGDTEIDAITGVLAMLALPWALKFLWAPLVDAARGPRWGYRHWIVAAQALMALTLAPLIFIDASASIGWIAPLLLVHAVAAATQDVAIDAWAIRLTPEREHGVLNASMQTGMIVGRWLFGAGLLLATAWVSRPAAIGALIAVIAAASTVVLICDEAVDETDTPSQNARQFVAHLRSALTGPVIWLGVVIALISGAAYEAVGAVVGPQLIDRGVAEATVGLVLSGNLIAMLAGVWIGGKVGDRVGHRRAMLGATVGLALIVAALGGLHMTETGGAANSALISAVVVLYAGIGVFVAASYAMFMDLTDPAVAGTQFSAFMAATNGCEIWAAALVGVLIAQLGYPTAFTTMAALSLTAIPLLVLLGRVRARQAASDSKSTSCSKSPE